MFGNIGKIIRNFLNICNKYIKVSRKNDSLGVWNEPIFPLFFLQKNIIFNLHSKHMKSQTLNFANQIGHIVIIVYSILHYVNSGCVY